MSADKYRSIGGGFGSDTAPSDAGYAAVIYAQGQLGIPYLWGGDGPAEGGFDCSGLTRAAYLAAGIDLPRTAQTQYEAGPVVPPGEPLQIGDLVYYGTATNIHHVAIYIGNGQMITAPGDNKVVRIALYRWKEMTISERQGRENELYSNQMQHPTSGDKRPSRAFGASNFERIVTRRPPTINRGRRCSMQR
ncbi:NLP/P60 protein [Parafrankia sp. EAN1pec]|nr:NLP/P60 protein [Frankia sp. EAN1pec]